MWEWRCVGCQRAGQRWCGACQAHGQWRPTVTAIPAVTAGWTLAAYHGTVGAAIKRVKGTSDRDAAVDLARWFGRAAEGAPWRQGYDGAVMTWAPSPWTRRWTRGFSLSSLLVQYAAAPARARALLAISPGRRQASLAGADRWLSVRGRVRALTQIAGPVILVDDVLTTGATLAACADVLRRNGATQVIVLTLAEVDAEGAASARLRYDGALESHALPPAAPSLLGAPHAAPRRLFRTPP
jgi:predicted amidophosphoribosyltransferase